MEVNIRLLNEEIQKKGWSINRLALMSNVDKASISRLLNGVNGCSVSTAQKITKALGLSASKAGKIFFG